MSLIYTAIHYSTASFIFSQSPNRHSCHRPSIMKFTTATWIAVAGYYATASARPLGHSSKARGSGAMVMNASNGTSMGAVYCMYFLSIFLSPLSVYLTCPVVITNQPEGNFVVSADINPDGTLVSDTDKSPCEFSLN